MGNIIEKYRQESYHDFHHRYAKRSSWRAAILESIFRPEMQIPGGKTPMSHLHPDIHKLHLPEGVYIADWRKYKVEDHPALVNFQKRCHAAGLHDPWLRHYACQFYPNQMHRRSILSLVTTGLGFGVVAAAGIFYTEKLVKKLIADRSHSSAAKHE